MEDTNVVEASTNMVGERDIRTTAGVRNEHSRVEEIQDRNQEGDNVHSGLGPEGAGKTFVVLDERGSF